MTDLAATIDAAWEDRASISIGTTGAVRDAVEAALALLDSGEARVAEPSGNSWTVNQWLKKAVLLSFRLNDNMVMPSHVMGQTAFDKVPLKFAGWGERRFREAGFRIVPGAVVRRGSFIGAVLSMGVFIGKSTKIVDRATGEVTMGEVPPYAVVVPGSIGGGEGKPALYCAVIIKRADAQTRAKTSINELLRD
jgi:2,3,4,5-tetrahydropyridine-2-carboxylate N-succinyltransferase